MATTHQEDQQQEYNFSETMSYNKNIHAHNEGQYIVHKGNNYGDRTNSFVIDQQWFGWLKSVVPTMV